MSLCPSQHMLFHTIPTLHTWVWVSQWVCLCAWHKHFWPLSKALLYCPSDVLALPMLCQPELLLRSHGEQVVLPQLWELSAVPQPHSTMMPALKMWQKLWKLLQKRIYSLSRQAEQKFVRRETGKQREEKWQPNTEDISNIFRARCAKMDLHLKKNRVWLGDHDSHKTGLQDFMIDHVILKNVEFNSLNT